ncbi:MAG: AMP-binding protein [Vicinamibacterales bacterium]
MNLWDVFGGVVARHGARPAVEMQRAAAVETVTYDELSARALAQAAWLAGHGVVAGDRCAIYADNGADWCSTYLGILRLGAVAVPLDSNYTAAQVATVVRDAGARVLFCNPRLDPLAREAASDTGVLVSTVHGVADLSHSAAGLPACPATGTDPAVILYTSGTTADPKGVVLSHGNLLAERDAAFGIVHVTEADAVLGVLPLFHALAQLANLLLPFAVGARVVFLETLDSTQLLRALAERRITVFCCVPQFFYLIHQRVEGEVQKGGVMKRAMFRALLGLNFRLRRMGVNVGPWLFGRVHDVMGRQMRLFVTGGSKFDPAVGRDLYALGFTILQAYGLTETSGAATLTRPDEAHLDTVGRALPGHEVRIVPREGGDGPDGSHDGEVAVRGPIVMQGYFNRPEATAAVMRDGWFLTGDLGRLDAEGRLTITGRSKEVIVLSSGKNIYPEEIEAHYRKSAVVGEICVMGLTTPDSPTTERLHAVVVPDTAVLAERRIVNAGDLLRFEMEGLAIGLPAHKRVLGYDVWFEPLPRTTTGKLKRFEIQRMVVERREQARQALAAPLSAADQAWEVEPHPAAALPIVVARARAGSRVTPAANLELDLGLDSMERVELLTELERRFGVRVPRERAHEILTVRQLVEAVRPDGDGRAAPAVGAAEPSWPVILEDLPPPSDPVLGGLLERRPVLTRVLFWAERLATRALVRVEVTGLEHLPASGPYLICPNHQSYLDPFIVCGVLPYRSFRELFFVGAAEYFQTPLMAWVAKTLNCVPVDPDANLEPAMKAGAFGLRHGKVLMLFPEGERSIDGTVKRFKKGASILSAHLGVPIVPVAISGVHELWPRNRPFQWSRTRLLGRHRVRIAFGGQVSTLPSTGYGDAAEELRGRVDRMWQDLGPDRLEPAVPAAD